MSEERKKEFMEFFETLVDSQLILGLFLIMIYYSNPNGYEGIFGLFGAIIFLILFTVSRILINLDLVVKKK
jgi:hypothetical protein